ncbi:hypothetical protein [Rhodococcus wratislaviensis]
MTRGTTLSSSGRRLEQMLAYAITLTILIGTYGGCIVLARLLIALGWAA